MNCVTQIDSIQGYPVSSGKIDFFGLKDFYLFDYEHLHVAVSQEHEEPFAIISKMIDMLDQTEPVLLKQARFLMAPFYNLKGEPNKVGASAASANVNSRVVFFFGTKHHQYDHMNFNTLIFHHELAHLMDESMGVPSKLASEWDKACEEDAKHHLTLPKLSIHREKVQFTGLPLTRQFLYNQKELNSYSANKETQAERDHEDWAESVSLYLLDKQQGYIWNGEYTFSFSEYYPYRTKVLTQVFTV